MLQVFRASRHIGRTASFVASLSLMMTMLAWNVMLSGRTVNTALAHSAELGALGIVAQSAAGVTGQYYDNADLTGLVFARTDPGVNFTWGAGSPDARVAPDSFSVRWTGEVRVDARPAPPTPSPR